MDIVEFLTARLDESAERAEYAQTVIGGDWDGWEPIAHQLAADCDTVPNAGRLDQHLQHNADPAHILREIAAKRAILAQVADMRSAGTLSEDWRLVEAADQIESHLARAYADHPDYDQRYF